jgi:hypothetical protein
MKKHLLIASLFLAAGSSMLAQNGGRIITHESMDNFARPVSNTSRNMTCTADTLQYGYIKELDLDATPGLLSAPLTGPGEEQSQAFISTETVNIVGVNFRAKVNSANPAAIIPTMVYLYTVDAAFMPLTRIDSALVTVSGTVGKFYNANFITPVAVTGNYAVAIRPATAFKISFYGNNAGTATTPYGEGLSYNKWNSGVPTWYPNADATNGWGQDFDAIISPIVTYPIATDYTVSPSTTVCLGTAINFTNTTTPAGNLGNRMYNYNAFRDYWNTATSDSTYVWDMGDASPAIWSSNASYTYPAAGVNTATLYTLSGFWKSCMDTKATVITVNAIDDATITGPATTCEASAAFDFTAPTAGGTWSGTGITSVSSGTFSPSSAGVGTYTITYTTNGTCPATDNASITVNATEDATIAQPGMLCDNGSAITLSAATAGGTWSGTGITDASAGTFDPSVAGSGTHVITYTTAGTCTGTDNVSIVVSVCIGINEANVASLSIYPNPSTGVFTIDFGSVSKSSVEVFNVVGSRVVAKEFNSQSAKLDMTGFDAGIYFIKVSTNNGQVTKKVTITK